MDTHRSDPADGNLSSPPCFLSIALKGRGKQTQGPCSRRRGTPLGRAHTSPPSLATEPSDDRGCWLCLSGHKHRPSPTWPRVVLCHKPLGKGTAWAACERGLVPAAIQRHILFWGCHGTAKHLPQQTAVAGGWQWGHGQALEAGVERTQDGARPELDGDLGNLLETAPSHPLRTHVYARAQARRRTQARGTHCVWKASGTSAFPIGSSS